MLSITRPPSGTERALRRATLSDSSSQPGLLYRCKLAIQLNDVPSLFECLGFSQHSPRQLTAEALQTLQRHEEKSVEERARLLSDTLLFQRLEKSKHNVCASLLIAIQDMGYMQRLLDLLQA